MDKRKMTLLAVIPAGLALTCLLLPVRQSAKTDGLEHELEETRKRAEEAVLIRSVSKQMEEITYQQKGLSDQQRMRAEQQARENYRMKLRVEEEWKRAVYSQQEAERAYKAAEIQRRLAEERRLQAENAKRKADTLAYLALGRSLGSTAITQYRTGNAETASLLAYSSWLFVKRYGGDIYQPSVFNPLTLTSGQPAVWHRHKAGISSIVWDKRDKGRFYTVGRYGEVLEWEETASGHETKTLYSDPGEDFRSACMDAAHTLHALTHTGKIVSFGNAPELHDTGKGKCVGILQNGTRTWLLAQDGRIYGPDGAELPGVRKATCMAEGGTDIYIGCADGETLRTSGNGLHARSLGNHHHAAVTAIATDTAARLTAWGYEDGTLLLTDSNGKYLKRLVGHRSAVTGLALHGGKLYSCSHDRTLRLWNLLGERTEPATVMEGNAWLLCLALSPDGKRLLVGDGNGYLYNLSVSPDDMAETILERLQRDFTPQEWLHYMGKGIPYETFTDKRHRNK